MVIHSLSGIWEAGNIIVGFMTEGDARTHSLAQQNRCYKLVLATRETTKPGGDVPCSVVGCLVRDCSFLVCLAHARLITRQRRQQFVPSSSSCDFVDAMATSPTVRGDLDEPVRGGLNEPAAEEETESFGKRAELDLLYPREAEFVPDYGEAEAQAMVGDILAPLQGAKISPTIA